MVPKEGVAIHINAFNFPVWGMLEKIAVNFAWKKIYLPNNHFLFFINIFGKKMCT